MSLWSFTFVLLIYIPLILLWIFTLIDLTKRSDISPLAKGLWAIAVVILPLIGMVVYFVMRPADAIVEPPSEEPATQEVDTDATIGQLEKYAKLHEAGTLSDDEFAAVKAKLLDTA